MIGIYLHSRVIVHCDSMATDKGDALAFQSVIEYLSKAFTYKKTSANVKRFKLISLSDAGLQQQTDNTSCGVFACVFAYSLLALKDYHVKQEHLPSVRYWIANTALKGTATVEQRPFKCKNQDLWDNIPYKVDRMQRTTKLHLERDEQPFSALRRFISGE